MRVEVSENLIEPSWDRYLSQSAFAQHEQTSQYGKIRTNYGFNLFRLIALEDNNIIGGIQVLVKDSPYGKFALIPQGPVVDPDRHDVVDTLVRTLDGEAVERKISKVRVCNYENQSYYEASFLKVGFEPSKLTWFQNETSAVDLSKDTDDLFCRMKKKARYNIRLAQKKGVLIEIGKRENLKEFYHRLQNTADAKHFPIFPLEYFLYLWDLFAEKQKLLLLLARYQGDAIAGLIVTRIGNTAFYGWGGTSREHSTLKASTYLHWHAIQKAKENGCQWYDLGRAYAKSNDSVSRFKLQFSGQCLRYPDPLDKYYGWMPNIKKTVSHMVWNVDWLRNKVESFDYRITGPLPY